MIRAASKAGRFVELDGVRAVAVLMVIAGHYTVTYDSIYGVAGEWPEVLSYGKLGVQLFFLVSGYVILMSVQRVTRASDFAISRFSRLFPAYWLAVTWSIGVALLLPARDVTHSWLDRLLNYTMVQRFIGAGAVDTVYWTLAIELQFYGLIWLLLRVTRCHVRTRHLVAVAAVWLAATTVIALTWGQYSRGHDPSSTPGPYKKLFNVTLVEYAPLFCTGMFLYQARQGRRQSWILATVSALAAVTQAGAMHDPGYGLAVALLCCAFFVVCAAPSIAALTWAPLQWVGRRSYSLYLIHNVTGLTLIHMFDPSLGRGGAMVVALGVSLLASAVLYRVGETWGTRLARRFATRLRDSLSRSAAGDARHAA